MSRRIQRSIDLVLRTGIRAAKLRAKANRRLLARSERNELKSFESRLKHRYSEAFLFFDAFVAESRQAGSSHYQRERLLAERDQDILFFALTRIHVRASLVASEIRVLLFSGHASGAMSRWRTLHELAIIAMFLEKHGHEAAEKYLDHAFIMLTKAAEEQMQHQGKLGFDLISKDELDSIRTHRDRLISIHGGSFRFDYGWAGDFVGKSKPSFTDIEESLDRGHWKPYVRLASQSVHAGFRGMQYDLGYGTFEPDVMLAGPSNAGLVEPAQCALIDLNIVTVTLLACRKSVKSVISLHVLNELMSDCQESFVEADEVLKRDERLIREANKHDTHVN